MNPKAIKRRCGLLAVICMAVVFSGCTSYDINPIEYSSSLRTAYVVRNRKMRTDGFESLLHERFNAAGIRTKTVDSSNEVPSGAYWVSYKGLWSWDLTLYLAHAEVNVYKGSQMVGSGRYHHRGTNLSLAPSKYKSSRSKMDPLYDELLENYISRNKR